MKLLRSFSVLGAFAAIVILTPTQARAIALSALAQGQTITADDKLFNNWSILDVTTANGGVVNTNQIDVTPLVDDPLNPGVKFTAPIGALGTAFGHPPGASATLRFSFDVQTTNGLPLIKDNSLLLNDFIFDSSAAASITISETVSQVTGLPLGTKQVVARPGDMPGAGNPNHFDSADFAPQARVHVEKLINVLGPGQNDGAFVLMFEQRFSQVPEPGVLILAGSFLLCFMASGLRQGRRL